MSAPLLSWNGDRILPNRAQPARDHADALRVLYLEDHLPDVELVRYELERAGMCIRLRHVQTRAEYIASLREFEPAIVISDHGLPAFDSISALKLLKEQSPHVPFILLTGTVGEERAIEFIKSGVTDYVLKDRLFRLPTAVRRALDEAAAHAERQRSQEALRESEERYSLAVRGASDGLWDWDIRRLRACPRASMPPGAPDTAARARGAWRSEAAARRQKRPCPGAAAAPSSGGSTRRLPLPRAFVRQR